MPDPIPPERGLTPPEFARLYRLGAGRVRAMILRGELGALDVATTRCGTPRYVILPRHIEEWEKRRQVGAPVKTARRKRMATLRDYYPDEAVA